MIKGIIHNSSFITHHSSLLHLFILSVSDIISTVAVIAWLLLLRATCLLSTLLLLGIVDMLTCSLPGGIEFFSPFVYASKVFSFMCFFQLACGSFDSSFLICRDFISVLFELFFSIKDKTISHIHLLYFLTHQFIAFFVGLRFVLHPFDLFFAQTTACFNTDVLLLSGSFVLSSDIQDAVGINIESNFH